MWAGNHGSSRKTHRYCFMTTFVDTVAYIATRDESLRKVTITNKTPPPLGPYEWRNEGGESASLESSPISPACHNDISVPPSGMRNWNSSRRRRLSDSDRVTLKLGSGVGLMLGDLPLTASQFGPGWMLTVRCRLQDTQFNYDK